MKIVDVVVVVVVVCFIQLGFRGFRGFRSSSPPPADRKPGPEPIGGAGEPRNSADRERKKSELYTCVCVCSWICVYEWKKSMALCYLRDNHYHSK